MFTNFKCKIQGFQVMNKDILLIAHKIGNIHLKQKLLNPDFYFEILELSHRQAFFSLDSRIFLEE